MNRQNETVTRAAAAAAGRYAAGGFVTIYDGVVGPWFLPTFGLATGLDSVHCEVVLPSVERCVERVRTRHGHGFTDEGATREMYRQFADADIDPRHFLRDPPDDPQQAAELVLDAFQAGRLTYLAPPS